LGECVLIAIYVGLFISAYLSKKKTMSQFNDWDHEKMRWRERERERERDKERKRKRKVE
jgi:hypothetical protein